MRIALESCAPPIATLEARLFAHAPLTMRHRIELAAAFDESTARLEAHREVCCPSSWASPMRIPSGPWM